MKISSIFVAFLENMNFNTSAAFVLISAENDHNFDTTEDRKVEWKLRKILFIRFPYLLGLNP